MRLLAEDLVVVVRTSRGGAKTNKRFLLVWRLAHSRWFGWNGHDQDGEIEATTPFEHQAGAKFSWFGQTCQRW
ncbi:MAG: hypothetical protein HC884_12820 [Chloroflexaceae bacterium]|nr:hypothetical protein [Chloroflexaceae bacterium]